MSDDELVYTRTLAAPRELVFACLTEPAHLTEFWGPHGSAAPLDRIVVELYVGGRFETLLTDGTGGAHLMQAVFTDITPPETLAWTEPALGMSTSVTLTALTPTTTELRIEQRNVPEPVRDPASRAGFLSSLDRMERHLAALVNTEEN